MWNLYVAVSTLQSENQLQKLPMNKLQIYLIERCNLSAWRRSRGEIFYWCKTTSFILIHQIFNRISFAQSVAKCPNLYHLILRFWHFAIFFTSNSHFSTKPYIENHVIRGCFGCKNLFNSILIFFSFGKRILHTQTWFSSFFRPDLRNVKCPGRRNPARAMG